MVTVADHVAQRQVQVNGASEKFSRVIKVVCTHAGEKALKA